MVRVYPKIISLSTQVSGANGGHTLTITGNGFSTTVGNNFVSLQGVPCNVTSASQTLLKCMVGPAPAVGLGAAPYTSTQGLLHRVYWNSGSFGMNSFINNANYPNNPSITRVQADGLTGYCANCAYYYGQQLEGFFVPKVSSYYQFYINSDDASDLFLSNNNSPANMTRIAYCPSYLPSYWSNLGLQRSTPLFLEAGRPYFLRTRQTQGNGGDYVNVAVRVINPPARSAIEQSMHSVHERQTVTITSSVRREIQRLNFTAASGKFMFYISDFGARSAQVDLSSTDMSLAASAVAVNRINLFITNYHDFFFCFFFEMIFLQCPVSFE